MPGHSTEQGHVSGISIKVTKPGTDPTITITSPSGSCVIHPEELYLSVAGLVLNVTRLGGIVMVEER